MMRSGLWLAAACALSGLATVTWAQLGDSSFDQVAHPAIQYVSRPPKDGIAALNRRIQNGEFRLAYDERQGYLPALLKALDIPIESQVVVFSKTSTQLNMITPQNPRTLYFNDSVAVGWLRGGFVLEAAAQDPEQGTMFYDLEQFRAEKPPFRRTIACLRCHHSMFTSGVPGLLVRSTPTGPDGVPMAYTRNVISDHRSPFDERWGGWYVTGRTAGLAHLGNAFAPRVQATAPVAAQPELETLNEKFDTSAYPTPYSDIVALMVLEHQTHLLNLMTRLGWETRAAEYQTRTGNNIPPLSTRAQRFSLEAAVNDVVDYLLFVDEAPLPVRVQGTSGFAEQFQKRGPFDRQGRSLRALDLERRLMRYPCSYLIYSPSFDALPASARSAVYRRLWQILSGAERAGKYARLSEEDRRTVLEILRETKKGLPDYFLN